MEFCLKLFYSFLNLKVILVLFALVFSMAKANSQSSEDIIGLLLEGNPHAEEFLKWAELSAKDQFFLDCYTNCLKADPNLSQFGPMSCQSTGRGTRNNCEELRRLSPKQRQRLSCTRECEF
jgi:hypothetical protein